MRCNGCDNYLCIYWSKHTCMLQEITLDLQGSCQDCIYVSLPEETLAQAKETTLLKLRDLR